VFQSGTASAKSFKSEAEAKKNFEKQVAAKKKKGYEEGSE
jgi:predicted DNA-binding WGR domain protein